MVKVCHVRIVTGGCHAIRKQKQGKFEQYWFLGDVAEYRHSGQYEYVSLNLRAFASA